MGENENIGSKIGKTANFPIFRPNFPFFAVEPKFVFQPFVTTVRFWENGFFSLMFAFELPDFLFGFSCRRFFFLIFLGRSAQKNPPRKTPAKLQQESPTCFCRGVRPMYPFIASGECTILHCGLLSQCTLCRHHFHWFSRSLPLNKGFKA